MNRGTAMKKIILVLLATWTILSCSSEQKDSPSEFVIGKGTNLAHWLSQSSKRGEERRLFIQEKDFEYIAELGFEHVRLPIDEEQMWDEQGNRHNGAFEIMTNIRWEIHYEDIYGYEFTL